MRTRNFEFFSLPSRRGSFRLSPHGTGSLSVRQEYLATEDGPHIQTGYHVSALLIELSQHMRFCVRGCHPVSRAFPDASTNTHADSGSGNHSPFARRYWESRLEFLFLGVLRCFEFPRFASLTYIVQLMMNAAESHWVSPFEASPVITVPYHLTG